MCDMTHPYALNDASICVTWLIHTCDMTHSYVWHVIHTCDMNHLQQWYPPQLRTRACQTHTNESHHIWVRHVTYRRVMAHVNVSWNESWYTWMCYGMSHGTHERVMESVMVHMDVSWNVSWHTWMCRTWVCRTWMRQGTSHGLCHGTYECVAHECVMAHMNVSHMNVSRNESWYTWMSHGTYGTHKSVILKACFWMSHGTHEWVMTHMAHINESFWRRVSEWVMVHMNESWHIWHT